MTPVVPANVSPGGRLPEVIDHVYAGVPPVACRLVAYAVLDVPVGSVDATIVSGVAATTTVTDADCVCTGLPLSWTLAVNVDVPLVVTVPEIVPVDGEIERPAGN
jgi:hypothetical protein